MYTALSIAAVLGIHSIRDVGQAIVDGVITGADYALLGIGFALILGVTGRFHFAYGIIYAITAYIAALGVGPWGLSLAPAALIGLIVGVLLGVACEAIVYRPLSVRAGENTLLAVFVASLGLVIAGENLIPWLWGNNTRNLGGFPDHTYTVANLNFSRIEVTLVLLTIAITVVLTLLLNRTIFGQQIKAVRGNPDMAQAVGANVTRIFLVVFAIGTLIAGVVALFDGMRFAVTPTMGDTPVFYAFVVAFVAGVKRSPVVVALVGLGVGLVQSLSTLWISQTESSLAVFALLLIWLGYRTLPDAIKQLAGALSRAHPTPPVHARKAA